MLSFPYVYLYESTPHDVTMIIELIFVIAILLVLLILIGSGFYLQQPILTLFLVMFLIFMVAIYERQKD